MKNHQTTTIPCSQKIAVLLLILLGSMFLLTGCPALYRALGLTEEQAAAQTAKDQADRQKLLDQVRFTSTEIISTALAGAGAILSALLARWLGTEKKINKAMITGVENSNDNSAKKAIRSAAIAAGVESKLHTRVKSLT